MWKGVKLKDVLAMAGMKPGAIDVTFQGLDKPAMPGTPSFVKSLRAAHAIDGEVLVAYEMNGPAHTYAEWLSAEADSSGGGMQPTG